MKKMRYKMKKKKIKMTAFVLLLAGMCFMGLKTDKSDVYAASNKVSITKIYNSKVGNKVLWNCLLYTSPSPRD